MLPDTMESFGILPEPTTPSTSDVIAANLGWDPGNVANQETMTYEMERHPLSDLANATSTSVSGMMQSAGEIASSIGQGAVSVGKNLLILVGIGLLGFLFFSGAKLVRSVRQ